MRWSNTSGCLGNINQVLHNRDLALFYADHDMKLAEALDLAQKELEVRHDIYTWDALAWALYKNGKLTEAAKASEKRHEVRNTRPAAPVSRRNDCRRTRRT